MPENGRRFGGEPKGEGQPKEAASTGDLNDEERDEVTQEDERDDEQEREWAWIRQTEEEFFQKITDASPEEQRKYALKEIERGDGWVVVNNLSKLQCLDKEFALAIFRGTYEINRVQDLALFAGLDKEALKLYLKQFKEQHAPLRFNNLNFLQYFSGADKEIAEELIKDGYIDGVMSRLVTDSKRGYGGGYADEEGDAPVPHDIFTGLDKETFLLALAAIDSETENRRKDRHWRHGSKETPASVSDLVKATDKFSGLDEGVFLLLRRRITGFGKHHLLRKLKSFHDLGQKLLEEILAAGGEDEAFALENLDAFSDLDIEFLKTQFHSHLAIVRDPKLPPAPPRQHIIAPYDNDDVYGDEGVEGGVRNRLRRLTSRHLHYCLALNECAGGKIDKILHQVYEESGDDFDIQVYDVYKELSEGGVPAAARELGVTEGGEKGMGQLKEVLKKLNGEIISGIINPDLVATNPLVRRAFTTAVRYEDSEWGNHDDAGLDQTISRYQQLKESLRPLPEVYKPSPIIDVAKVDQEKQKEFQHTPDFLARYNQILFSLKEARTFSLEEKEMGIQKILVKIEKRVAEVREQLRGKLGQAKNEKARANIEENLKKLEAVNVAALSPEEQFNALRSFKDQFDGELRELIFFMGYHFNPNYLEKNLDEFSVDHPTANEVTWVMNFVDHIVNKETLSKYFTDKEAAKNFRGLTNVTALQQGLERYGQQGTKGAMSMQFVPDRSILTEFSGHIADACWASNSDSILEKHPNIITLLMVQNPDAKHERLAGASMLIETEGAEGEKLLVIRGLNPQENVVNQLSVEDFYKNIVNYLKPIAEKDGRQLAIVIDDKSGGSSTNRPILFGYLQKQKATLKKVALKSADDTTFNGYNIVNYCYLVE